MGLCIRNDESENPLGFIAKAIAEASSDDYRQQSIADGFFGAICEYLLHGNCDR
jgi:hypothetical protein